MPKKKPHGPMTIINAAFKCEAERLGLIGWAHLTAGDFLFITIERDAQHFQQVFHLAMTTIGGTPTSAYDLALQVQNAVRTTRTKMCRDCDGKGEFEGIGNRQVPCICTKEKA